MGERLKEKQSEGLGGVLPMEMEEEMGEDSIPRLLWKEIREIGRRNGHPASDGRGRRDITVHSPAIQESQQMTPPTPAPSEDRFLTDWSSIRMRSPPCEDTTPKYFSERKRARN